MCGLRFLLVLPCSKGFLRVLPSSSLYKNQHPLIPIQAGYKTWDGSRKGLEASVETPKLNKIRHYLNTLTWPENAGNRISENLNFLKFQKIFLDPVKVNCLWYSSPVILNPYLRLMWLILSEYCHLL